MKQAVCPTCGEKRWIPIEFGECSKCHETTNLLNGRKARLKRDEGRCGFQRLSPFNSDKLYPLEQ
jgi:hypothetical protein